MLNFEKLEVWKKSIVLADLVYVATKSFPADERFGLTSQMRRSAVSISSNLAEGSSRGSKADFRRFVEIATGSTFELASQAQVALNQQLLSPEQHRALREAALEIVRMLSGLRSSLGE
ncbi:MAG TPA: four helix bundle protein [Opitutus sp.]|nr:four helix bundle protein [Opitutus sp.]